jgi:hypothetical protein
MLDRKALLSNPASQASVQPSSGRPASPGLKVAGEQFDLRGFLDRRPGALDLGQTLRPSNGVAQLDEDLAEIPRAASLLDAAPARPELRWPRLRARLGEAWRMLS